MVAALRYKTVVNFDRRVIKTNWNKINESPLKKAGLEVRRIARGSVRRGNPGTPRHKRKPGKQRPKSWVPGNDAPFKLIFSVPNRLATSVLVGFVGFGGPNPAPGLHEHGGTAVRRVFADAGQRRTKKGRFGKKITKLKRKTVRVSQTSGDGPRPGQSPQQAAPHCGRTP